MIWPCWSSRPDAPRRAYHALIRICNSRIRRLLYSPMHQPWHRYLHLQWDRLGLAAVASLWMTPSSMSGSWRPIRNQFPRYWDTLFPTLKHAPRDFSIQLKAFRDAFFPGWQKCYWTFLAQIGHFSSTCFFQETNFLDASLQQHFRFSKRHLENYPPVAFSHAGKMHLDISHPKAFCKKPSNLKKCTWRFSIQWTVFRNKFPRCIFPDWMNCIWTFLTPISQMHGHFWLRKKAIRKTSCIFQAGNMNLDISHLNFSDAFLSHMLFPKDKLS